MEKRSVDFKIVTFLAITHILGIAGFVYIGIEPAFPWKTLILGIVSFAISSLTVTGGLHRYYSHRSYRCAKPMAYFYALVGPSNVQGSPFEWVANHRRHHRYADGPLDPHNIKLGFWWAHILWILFKHESYIPGSSITAHGIDISDLTCQPLLQFQYRWYNALAAFWLIAPCVFAGLLWGDWIGGLLFVTFSRLLLQYHFTWSVNSFAHYFGPRQYSSRQTARDNVWVGSVSLGEGGGHGFHHQFERDYRNGVRWFDLDPTKWAIWSCAFVGLASNLHRTEERLIRKAKELARMQFPATDP